MPEDYEALLRDARKKARVSANLSRPRVRLDSLTTTLPEIPAASLGKFVGAGSQKDVYLLDGGRCIAFLRDGSIGPLDSPVSALQREIDNAAELERRGFPIVKIHGLRQVNGHLAIEQDHIAEAMNSTDIVKSPSSVPASRYLTRRLVDDCDVIIERLRETNTRIDDLQFLVEPSGQLRLHDARAVETGNPQRGIDEVKQLRGLARERLLSSDDSDASAD